MKIKIRLAEPDDVKQIVNINKRGWLSTYLNSEYKITKEDILSRDFKGKIEKWKNIIRNNKNTSRFWVAESKENIIGYASAEKRRNFNGITLYILPKFQSIGIGTRLIKKTFKWLGEEKKIKIGVVSYNTKALNFYTKHGFLRVERGEKRLPTGKIIPLVLMVKR